MRLLLLLLALPLLAQRPIPIDNDWARVVVAKTSPGPKGRMHKHDQNRVMIYLDKGAQQLAYQDGSKTDISFGPGEVQWSPKGGMHTSENTGGTTFRVVEIELKKNGGSAAGPRKGVELENSQVRVRRIKLGPRQKLTTRPDLPYIIVPLTEIDLGSVKGQPGDALFAEPGNPLEENRLDRGSEFLIVELKG